MSIDRVTFGLLIVSLPFCYFTVVPAMALTLVYLAQFFSSQRTEAKRLAAWNEKAHDELAAAMAEVHKVRSQNQDVEELKTQLAAISLRLGIGGRG
jgi:hypothetical protein